MMHTRLLHAGSMLERETLHSRSQSLFSIPIEYVLCSSYSCFGISNICRPWYMGDYFSPCGAPYQAPTISINTRNRWHGIAQQIKAPKTVQHATMLQMPVSPYLLVSSCRSVSICVVMQGDWKWHGTLPGAGGSQPLGLASQV